MTAGRLKHYDEPMSHCSALDGLNTQRNAEPIQNSQGIVPPAATVPDALHLTASQ